MALHDPALPLLKAALHTDPNPVKGGGDITIVGGVALLPDSGPLGTAADITEIPKHGEISSYVVRSGDTLSGIAAMFDVSVNTILWANNLSSRTIRPGQELVILPVSGVRYSVKKGDTLSSIAKSYKGDAEEIALFNDLHVGDALTAGTTIIIPGGEVAVPVPARLTSPVRSTGALVDASGYYTSPAPGTRLTQGLHGYNAIDLGAGIGTPVLAAAGGRVIVARASGWNGGYGAYIVISHGNGTQTLYAHLSSLSVSSGDTVSQGDTIGGIGSTGRSTGPHLHFEVRGAKNPFTH
jgi:murein DD-endopeptidase MepM/ murein hydrolase activator NlpD